MKHSMHYLPTFSITIASAILLSSLMFSVPARERRVEHKPARHETVRRAPAPSHRHYHYSYRRGHFFNVSAAGRVVIAAPFGKIVLGLPIGYRSMVYGREHYFYFDGIFYRRHNNGYIIVQAPRVRYIPYGARRVVVNEEVYFVQNDTWYCTRDGEYELCPPPVAVETEQPQENVRTTIIIDNSNGSRTPVELEPLGANQWKGPRGEIYDGLPSEEQLREGYGF